MTGEPFEDLLAGLTGSPPESATAQARLDPDREHRAGVPEVIYAPGKEPDLVIGLATEILTRNGRVIVSRPSPETRTLLARNFNERYRLEGSWTVGIEAPDTGRTPTGGHVGIITAGSSDIPYAEEAAIMARHMDCRTTMITDVGVAGLHRLFPPLKQLLGDRVDAIVVAAGMDGALPSVVAGLVNVPVIGLPTSTGYGAGGKGIAAMLSMLQTCSPGLAVVNIDNGIGAGSTAALIANRVAEARRNTTK